MDRKIYSKAVIDKYTDDNFFFNDTKLKKYFEQLVNQQIVIGRDGLSSSMPKLTLVMTLEDLELFVVCFLPTFVLMSLFLIFLNQCYD